MAHSKNASIPESQGTRIKGASLLARMEYLASSFGPEVLERVLASLDEGDHRQLAERLLPSTLYSLELIGRLDDAIAQELDPDRPGRIYRRLGRASAERNLTSIHRIFLRGKGPHDVLTDFPSVRRTYYTDGDASYDPFDNTEGVLRVAGATSHTTADCESTAGYFERAIELIGGTGVRVILRCRRAGDEPACTFHCHWQ